MTSNRNRFHHLPAGVIHNFSVSIFGFISHLYISASNLFIAFFISLMKHFCDDDDDNLFRIATYLVKKIIFVAVQTHLDFGQNTVFARFAEEEKKKQTIMLLFLGVNALKKKHPPKLKKIKCIENSRFFYGFWTGWSIIDMLNKLVSTCTFVEKNTQQSIVSRLLKCVVLLRASFYVTGALTAQSVFIF